MMSKNQSRSLRRTNIEITTAKRKECLEKALKIVHQLIEKDVIKEQLLESVSSINQEVYQDIVDERSLGLLCGYVLCNNAIKNVSNQQYKISRLNGSLILYDTTERKKFCTNLCYKAAKYIKDQLPSCPLWLIKPEDTKSFHLIPADSKKNGSAGDIVNLNAKNVKESAQCKSDIGIKHNEKQNLQKKEQEEAKSEEKTPQNVQNKNPDQLNNNDSVEVRSEEMILQDVDDEHYYPSNSVFINDESVEVNEFKDALDVVPFIEETNFSDAVSLEVRDHLSENNDNGDEYSDCNDGINKVIKSTTFEDIAVTTVTSETASCSEINEKLLCSNKETNAIIKVSRGNRKKKSKHKPKVDDNVSPMLAAVLRTEQCIREWVSLDTLLFIFGEDKLKNIINERCNLENMEHSTNTRQDIVYERYLEIHKKLTYLELSESKVDDEVRNENNAGSVGGPTKPVPDYERLKEEAKKMEIKVKSFYQGDRRVQFKESNSDDKSDKDVYVPLVDQHAQKALRRKIVLDHLNRVLPDLLRALGLNKFSQNITYNVKRLVETFSLSAHNITFRQAEWNFIAIVILKLLSECDDVLNKILLMERADKYLTLMLMSYEQDSGYLSRLITWLLYEHSLFQSQ